MVTTGIYYSFLKNQENGNAIDLDTDTLHCALFTYTGSATVANLSSTNYVTLTNECATSGNYVKEGVVITGATLSGTDTVKFTTSAITFTNLTTTARYGVIYRLGSSELIMYVDFGEDQSPAGQNLLITPASTGLITKTVV